LIHHPLADTEVVIDPFLEILVISDFVGAETGAVKIPTRFPRPKWGRGVIGLAEIQRIGQRAIFHSHNLNIEMVQVERGVIT
jgi:hypothetical protein